MCTFSFFSSQIVATKIVMILTETLKPLSNLFKLENIKFSMNFLFYFFVSSY